MCRPRSAGAGLPWGPPGVGSQSRRTDASENLEPWERSTSAKEC
jgi:hypothetical protein